MTPNPPDAPLSLRLRARVGPELVASILSAAVIVLVVAIALWLPRPSGIAAHATPSATAGPTGPSSAGAPATATPSATATPEPNVAARALLEIVDRLVDQRADLEGERSKRRPSVQVLAEMLRDINTSLLLMDAPLGLLEADPAAADLATRIRATKDATFAAISRTQRASITNAKAYRDGAAEVVATLAPLVELRAELAVLAWGPSGQPVGTAEPTGSTP